MTKNHKRNRRHYTLEELYNPQIDLNRDATLYGRQSSKEQVIENIQSHISQTVKQLEYTRSLGFKDDGSTGKVTLFVENEVVDENGNVAIKNASGTWPIDRRPGLKTICDLIETGTIGVVIAEFVDRLFRDEDRIDSNVFIKICRENDCYVHISSKHMTYNFANDQHAEMFRLEVQMAAMYIKNHVKGTMLRRRDMLVQTGQWCGIGAIPVGYIICNDDENPLSGKFIPYEPHAAVVLWIFTRFIELGYDFGALRKEIREMPFVFPAFLPGTPIIRFMLTPTQNGYLISDTTLREMLTNEVYIGTFRRQIIEGEVYIEKNHPSIVPEDIFWLAYDHLKDTRPDGTSTGRNKQVRYNQEKTCAERQPLLVPISDDGKVYWQPHDDKQQWSYKIVKRLQLGLHHDHLINVAADVLETAVVKRLFERLHTLDLKNLNEQRAAIRAALSKNIKKINREIETINEDLETLKENMKRIKTDSVVAELEKDMAKSLARRSKAEGDKEKLERALNQDTLGTLEEELVDLEELWPFKPFAERKALLGLLIKSLSIKFLSSHFYRVEIHWNYDNWGVEQAVFYRQTAGRKDWTEEELAMIANYYPQAPQAEMLSAMPTRTWASIYQQAFKMGLERNVMYRMEYPKYLTWKDMERLKENDLTTADFHEFKYKVPKNAEKQRERILTVENSEEQGYKFIVVNRTTWC